MKKNLFPKLKCPKCGSTNIRYEDTYDIVSDEIDNEVGLKEYSGGRCLDCGAELQWMKCYKPIGYSEIFVEED